MKSYGVINGIKKFFIEDAEYHKNNKTRIQQQNAKILRISCIAYICVLLLYTVLTCVTSKSLLHKCAYFFFDAIHIALTIIVFLKTNKDDINLKLSQVLCYIFEATLLIFFAVEGGILYSTIHSLYVSIALLLVMLIFIHRAKYIFVISFVYTAVYAVMSFIVKTPDVAIYDLYIAVATLIASCIGCVVLNNFRHSEGTATNKLEYLSSMDQLTSTYNRRTIENICNSYTMLENGENVGSYAVIIMDIDNFKNINDTYGHNIGDDVLSGFGTLLKDLFGEKNKVGRFGGDEFLILMTDNANTVEEVNGKMSALIEKVAQFSVTGVNERISCSCGVAFIEESNSQNATFGEIFVCADKALYKAKNGGKNQFVIDCFKN